MVEVVKTEEKGSDVNLAVHLLNDAWLDVYDCAVFAFEIQRSLLCTVGGANSTPSFSLSLRAGVFPPRFNDFSSPHWGLFNTALHPVRFKTVILTLIFPNEIRQFRKVFNNLNDRLSKFKG